MTEANTTKKFLEILNFTVEDRGYCFDALSKISDILKPDVVDSEVMLGCAADAMGVSIEDLDQAVINPERDDVSTMMSKLEGLKTSA